MSGYFVKEYTRGIIGEYCRVRGEHVLPVARRHQNICPSNHPGGPSSRPCAVAVQSCPSVDSWLTPLFGRQLGEASVSDPALDPAAIK